jgi:FkbM family methyltransferase
MSTLKSQPVTPQLLASIQQAFQGHSDQLIANRQRIAALEARQQLADESRKPRRRIEFRSQFGEDLWIWDVLGWQTQGFFIEVGAFDGYHYSVTYALEAMGWNGLLIEALPGPYAKCRESRPNSRVVNAALGRRGATGTAKFVSVHDQYGGMLSYADAKTDHARTIAQNKFKTTTIEANLTSLDELLKDHTGPIDAAVIDVEGAELDVLNGFDLDKHKPRLLLLEDNEMGKNPALGDYMSTKPYIFAGWLAVNRLYVRADEEKMLERLKRY